MVGVFNILVVPFARSIDFGEQRCSPTAFCGENSSIFMTVAERKPPESTV